MRLEVAGLIDRLAWRVRALVGPKTDHARFSQYLVPPEKAGDHLAQAATDIERLFYGNTGRIVHKWMHYLPIYERHLGHLRDRPFKMLEIGVFKGGSLEFWRRYFGPEMTLFGVDIDPACANYVDPPNYVRIGSQDDPAFLRSVVSEMGGVDVVLDDGSHVSQHQLASFRALFPLLSEGGIYMIEDTHTSYWTEWGGGYRKKGTAIEFAKSLIDDIHGWYHPKQAREDIASITFHDSVIVIEKRRQQMRGHIQIGQSNSAQR